VFVRASKRESARQRIDAILSRCEAELQTVLPRPVVLEGELGEPALGLDQADLRWISRHCRSVIHNAASLTFQGSSREGEPWRSNLDGTRRILDLCRTTGIWQFHQISTAYVCGLREGRILETELDVNQKLGNDYERSKVAAEKLVRATAWIDSPTVYRPAIIVGDSQTGYTATFHGFYAALKLAHTLVSRMVRGSTAGHLMLDGLGLSGKERKNLVPVDWVSAVFTHIFSRPEHHGRTYHLVSRRPPSTILIANVIQEAVEKHSSLASGNDAFQCSNEWFIDNFRDQIEIYRPYWRDDPEFDDSQRAAAAPLACPEIDAAMLLKLAAFAIRDNFGKARPGRFRPGVDIHERIGRLRRDLRLASNVKGSHRLGLDVDGPGGGQWKLVLQDGRLMEAEDGICSRCSAVLRLDARTFHALGSRELAAAEAMRSGRLVIRGNGLAQAELAAILEAAAVHGMPDAVEPSWQDHYGFRTA
jgi:nucleoside-diphosphate-sugar epimerase